MKLLQENFTEDGPFHLRILRSKKTDAISGDGILEGCGTTVERAEVVVLVHGNGDDAAVCLVVEKAPDNLSSNIMFIVQSISASFLKLGFDLLLFGNMMANTSYGDTLRKQRRWFPRPVENGIA